MTSGAGDTRNETVRRLVVNLGPLADAALTKQAYIEGLNKTTIVNRALQIYELVMTAQQDGKPVVIGGDSVRII